MAKEQQDYTAANAAHQLVFTLSAGSIHRTRQVNNTCFSLWDDTRR